MNRPQRQFELILIVTLITIVLTAVQLMLDATPAKVWPSTLELIKAVVPNLIAAALVALAALWYRNRSGAVSPEVAQERSPVPRSSEATSSENSPKPQILNTTAPQDISQFVATLKGKNVIRFYVLAISGRVTVSSLLNAIERAKLAEGPLECRVLLRSPLSSDKKRSDAFLQTQSELGQFQALHPQFRFEIRTYASATPLHAVLAEHSDGVFSGYLSYYDWTTTLNRREGKSNYSSVIAHCECYETPIGVYLSWFDHFWGRHKIHTIMFDFDDTLFHTTDAQVKGWEEAIRWGITKNIVRLDDLREDVRSAFRNHKQTPLMTNIFLQEQDEESIFRRVFCRTIPEDSRALLRQQRIAFREKFTEQDPKPIVGVIRDVERLCSEYQLVIVSATSETLINRILEKNNLKVTFPFILGRGALTRRWRQVENKAQLFIGVSNMLGIPLERMIFVGDSDADYRASSQLGVHFIENRYNAARHEMPSLVKTLDAKIEHFISKQASEGELIAQVKKIEADLENFAATPF
jgi:phosphoglycolate phosphatase-like HAD superfamily hydrolase